MKRVFISFAKEDDFLRDYLAGQAKNKMSPFEYFDMSVKDPWDSQWKTNCRTKIRGCDGMIAIVTSNSFNAEGEQWEINCAKEENIPVMCINGRKDENYVGQLFCNVKVISWSWENIKNFLDSI